MNSLDECEALHRRVKLCKGECASAKESNPLWKRVDLCKGESSSVEESELLGGV